MQAFTSNPAARGVPPSSPYAPSQALRQRHHGSPSLLPMIERHLRETGISPSRLGRVVANDSRLVFDLRNGRAVGAGTAEKIDAYFRGYFRGLAAQSREG